MTLSLILEPTALVSSGSLWEMLNLRPYLRFTKLELALDSKKKKKKSTFNAGNTGSVLDSGRSPGGGNGNLLQYSCLRNATERRPWWATVHGVPESDITCPLNNNKISLKKYNS